MATNAARPVFKLAWLDRCQHVTTVGPKARDRHEAPADIASWADRIVSDSPQQISAQGAGHFLADALSCRGVCDLGEVLGPDISPDTSPDTSETTKSRTLYLSAGLASSEVALLAAISGQTPPA